MKYAGLVLLVVMTVMLQISFFGEARPFGVVPNLLLILVIYIGLALGAAETIVLAMVGGMLLDFASGTDFGLRMAFFTVLALGVMVLAQAGADLENLSAVVILTVGATILYNLAVIASLAPIHVNLNWGSILSHLVLELGLNVLAALVARPILLRWLKRPQAVSAMALRGGGGT